MRMLSRWDGTSAARLFPSSDISLTLIKFFVDFSPDFGAGCWSAELRAFALLKFVPAVLDFLFAITSHSSTRGELLAVACLIATFGPLLKGRPFVLFVDAKNVSFATLKWSSGTPEADQILKCIASLLAFYDTCAIIQVIPRRFNAPADCLSKGDVMGFKHHLAGLRFSEGRFDRVSASTLHLPAARFWPRPAPSFSPKA
jgi:hypothetical protein